MVKDGIVGPRCIAMSPRLGLTVIEGSTETRLPWGLVMADFYPSTSTVDCDTPGVQVELMGGLLHFSGGVKTGTGRGGTPGGSQKLGSTTTPGVVSTLCVTSRDVTESCPWN